MVKVHNDAWRSPGHDAAWEPIPKPRQSFFFVLLWAMCHPVTKWCGHPAWVLVRQVVPAGEQKHQTIFPGGGGGGQTVFVLL